MSDCFLRYSCFSEANKTYKELMKDKSVLQHDKELNSMNVMKIKIKA